MTKRVERSGANEPHPAGHDGIAQAPAVREPSAGRSGRPRSFRPFIMPALLAVAGVAAIAVILGNSAAGQAGSDLPSKREVLGSANAALVIREYADFQCTSCGAFARNVEPQVRAAYVDTGLVRFEWHDFAWIGPESREAANAARCAGDQDKFWAFHDLLYKSQAGENQGAFAKDRLKAMGVQLALEPGAFARCVDGGGHAAAVAQDFDDVRAKGFNSTPTFLIGNQRIVGAQPFDVFKAAIDGQLGG